MPLWFVYSPRGHGSHLTLPLDEKVPGGQTSGAVMPSSGAA